MKVAITTSKELDHPKLEINVYLEEGVAKAILHYDCSRCAGYGCRNQPCDNKVYLNPEDVMKTIGPQFKSVLENLFKQITG